MELQAVIFDWAGTTVDHGSLAPVVAIRELFACRGVKLSEAEIRRDMGLAKRDHIASLAGDADVDELYTAFQPLQMEILAAHAGVIAGVPELAARLRARGLRLGATTGYTRPMLDVLQAAAAAEGFAPDRCECPEDAGGGRPAPWMCLRLALDFRLGATAAAVKIGDTPSDIAEGLNAGMWTIGVAATGNEVGLSAAAWAALEAGDKARRLAAARARLTAAGAHYVIDSAADCEPTIKEIAGRLRAGERP